MFAVHIKFIFIMLLLSILNSVQALAKSHGYTMPVGVPETSINFEQDMPSRPRDWSQEVPGYYYIDQENGSQSAAYGSERLAKKYLPTPIPAGSYIEISGNYNHAKPSGIYHVLSRGTNDTWVANESGPVWITQAKNAPAAFTAARVLFYGENLFVTDIDFNQGAAIQVGSMTNGYAAENIVVRNVDVTGGGINILGASETSGSKNVIVYNSSFHDAGDINADFDEDAHLINIGSGCSNIWLLNNTGYNASGAGVQVLGDSTTTHNIYVGGNEFYNIRQSGLWVKHGKDVVFSSNYIHDVISTPWSVSKGIGAQYEPNGLWIINNRISGAQYGVRIASTKNTAWKQKVYIIGNVIHDINALGEPVGPISSMSSWQPAAIHLAGAHEHYIYNNLIFNAPNGIDSSTPGIMQIRNNIILDVSESQPEGQHGYHILAEIQDLNDKVFIENNYFGADMRVQVRHDIYDVVDSLNETKGAKYNVAGNNFITADNIDALMSAMTIDGIDYTQLENKGAYVNDILVEKFTSVFGTTSINTDIFGMPRVQSDAIDIGPFEKSNAKPENAIPAKPSNVEVHIKEPDSSNLD